MTWHMDDQPSLDDLSESDAFALLAHRRRRLLLRLLQDYSTPFSLAELATLVAECEYENPSVDLRRVVYVSLYHTHLPKLEEAGVILHDPDRGTVTEGPTFDVLVDVLAGTNRLKDWNR